jgi:hypothetical protein
VHVVALAVVQPLNGGVKRYPVPGDSVKVSEVPELYVAEHTCGVVAFVFMQLILGGVRLSTTDPTPVTVTFTVTGTIEKTGVSV